MKNVKAKRIFIFKPFFPFFLLLIFCFGCGAKEEDPFIPQQSTQNDKEFKPEVITNSTLIIVGRVKYITAAGTPNAHVIVSQVLHGNLQKEKELVVVFNEKAKALEDKEVNFIFCLKPFQVRDKNSEIKVQWAQFTNTIPLCLGEATESNIDRVKKALVKNSQYLKKTPLEANP